MRRLHRLGVWTVITVLVAGEASAGPASWSRKQLAESGERAASVAEGMVGWPLQVGERIALQIRWTSQEEFSERYLLAYRNALNILDGEGIDASEWLQVGTLMEALWEVWKAENGLRWLFLRDAALVGLFALFPGVAVLWWVTHSLVKPEERPDQETGKNEKYRLPVLPDQPLDFHLPEGRDTRESPLYGLLEKEGLGSPFFMRIIAIYAAASEHPASIGDHGNAPGGLVAHVQRTLLAMARLVRERSREEKRLFCLMALLHDIGKLAAYQKEGDVWVDRRLFHDRLSAQIAASLPELYRELGRADRDALLPALRYYHSPDEMPTSSPPLAEHLMDLMHRADSVAHEEEKETLQQQINEIKPYLWEAFCAALPHLNINRINGGYPDGFTSEGLVFVLEHALREKTLDRLPETVQRGLPIKRQTGRLHPAWPLLVEALSERNILITAVDGKKANPSALFNITANGTTYKCVVALSRTAVEAVAGPVTGKWREYPSYEVKIAGGRHGEEEQRSS